MGTAAALRRLERGREEGAEAVDFGGGEPTLRDDLPELARAAARLGYRDVGVKSNGLRLCYPDYLESLMAAGIRSFSVPVWGRPAEHDALCGVKRAFDMLEMGVKHALDFGAQVQADLLLTSLSVAHAPALAADFAALGVRRFSARLYCLFGSGFTRPHLLPGMTEAGRATVEAARVLAPSGASIATGHIPPCLLGPMPELYDDIAKQELIVVTPGGEFPAETSPFEAGNQTPRCAGCAYAGRCRGPRIEYVRERGDGEFVPVRGA